MERSATKAIPIFDLHSNMVYILYLFLTHAFMHQILILEALYIQTLAKAIPSGIWSPFCTDRGTSEEGKITFAQPQLCSSAGNVGL